MYSMFFSMDSFNKTASSLLTILGLCLFFWTSCSENSGEMELQKGDILLCAYEKDGLSAAIDEVTQTGNETHFSHMGIVSIENLDTFVYHASTKKDVAKELLSHFIFNENPAIIDVYRLKSTYLQSIDSILNEANKYIGLPYNFSYVLNDSTYYCSQFIYQLFKNQGVFQLDSMTFKNPESGAFSEAWVEYYNNLGMDIPEGEMGCNPNGLATSDKMERIKRLL